MKKRLFVALLSLSIVTSTIGQVSEKSPQDVQKEKGWSGSQMPSWVFYSLGHLFGEGGFRKLVFLQ